MCDCYTVEIKRAEAFFFYDCYIGDIKKMQFIYECYIGDLQRVEAVCVMTATLVTLEAPRSL